MRTRSTFPPQVPTAAPKDMCIRGPALQTRTQTFGSLFFEPLLMMYQQWSPVCLSPQAKEAAQAECASVAESIRQLGPLLHRQKELQREGLSAAADGTQLCHLLQELAALKAIRDRKPLRDEAIRSMFVVWVVDDSGIRATGHCFLRAAPPAVGLGHAMCQEDITHHKAADSLRVPQ